MVFYPDNDKRQQRADSLAADARSDWQTYVDNLNRIEESTKEFEESVEKILQKCGKQLEAVLPYEAPPSHFTHEGGFNPHYSRQPYQIPKLITRLIYGTSLATYTIRYMQGGRALYNDLVRIYTLAYLTRNVGPRQGVRISAEAVEEAVQAAGRISSSISWRAGLEVFGPRVFVAGLANFGITVVIELALDFWQEKGAYEELLKMINQMSETRLAINRQRKLTDILNNAVTQSKFRASSCLEGIEKGLYDPQKFDIVEQVFNPFYNEVSTKLSNLQKDCLKELEERDKLIENNYTADDPDMNEIAARVFAPTRLKQIRIKHGWVVDSIQCVLSQNSQNRELIQWGGDGGKTENIDLKDDETITEVRWRAKNFAGVDAIANLTIKTNKNPNGYGPYGSGSNTEDYGEIVAETPKNLEVVSLIGQKEMEYDSNGEIKKEQLHYVEALILVGRQVDQQ